MITSKTTAPSVPKKTISVKNVHFENGLIVDEDGSILDRLHEFVGDDEFSFNIKLTLQEGDE